MSNGVAKSSCLHQNANTVIEKAFTLRVFASVTPSQRKYATGYVGVGLRSGSGCVIVALL